MTDDPLFESEKAIHVYTPRLAHPEQIIDFKKKIIDERT